MYMLINYYVVSNTCCFQHTMLIVLYYANRINIGFVSILLLWHVPHVLLKLDLYRWNKYTTCKYFLAGQTMKVKITHYVYSAKSNEYKHSCLEKY